MMGLCSQESKTMTMALLFFLLFQKVFLQIRKGICATSTVNLRSSACGDIIRQANVNEFFQTTGNNVTDCSYLWIELTNGLWAAESFFTDCVEIVNICAKQVINLQSNPCETSTNNPTTLRKKYRTTGTYQTDCNNEWVEIRDFEGTLFWTHIPTDTSTFEKCYSKTMSSFTAQDLIDSQPGLSQENAETYLPFFNEAIIEGDVTTCDRLSSFSAQIGQESGSLFYWEELADGTAYEGRVDLCNTEVGDGPRFKGRGPIQLTGRCNYQNAGDALGLDLINNPEIVATPQVGFRTTMWFWTRRSLNSYSDYGDRVGFDIVTTRVNGGLNGKAERDARYLDFRDVFGCDESNGYVLQSELDFQVALVTFLAVGIPLIVVFSIVLIATVLIICGIVIFLDLRHSSLKRQNFKRKNSPEVRINE